MALKGVKSSAPYSKIHAFIISACVKVSVFSRNYCGLVKKKKKSSANLCLSFLWQQENVKDMMSYMNIRRLRFDFFIVNIVKLINIRSAAIVTIQ